MDLPFVRTGGPHNPAHIFHMLGTVGYTGVSPGSPQNQHLMPLTALLSVGEKPRSGLPLLRLVPEAQSGSSVGTDRMATASSAPGNGGIGFCFNEQGQGKLAPGSDALTLTGPQKLPSKGRGDPREPFPWADSAERPREDSGEAT